MQTSNTIIKLLAFFTIFLFTYDICYSQKSKKDLEVANAYFEIGEYAKAREYYMVAYHHSHSLSTTRKIAKCNYIIRNYSEAETWYQKLYKSKSYKPIDL